MNLILSRNPSMYTYHAHARAQNEEMQIYNGFFSSCIDQPKSRSKIDIQVFKIFKHKGTKSQKWYMFTFVESAYNWCTES